MCKKQKVNEMQSGFSAALVSLHDHLDFVFGDCNQRSKVRKNVCVGIISRFNKKIAVNSALQCA